MDSTSPYHPSSTEHLPHVVRRSGTQGELLLELEDVHDQGELAQVARMYKTHKTENNRQTSDVKTCGANSLLCCSMPTLPRIMRAAIAHNIVASTLICNNFIGSAKRVVQTCTRDTPQGRSRLDLKGGSKTHLRGGIQDTPQGWFNNVQGTNAKCNHQLPERSRLR